MLSQKSMNAAVFAVVLALIAYIGYAFYDARRDPMQTVLAAESQVEDTLEMTGWVLRDEEILSGSGTDITVIASEGQRLACGESYAVRYTGDQSRDRISQRSALEERITQIRQVLRGDGTASVKAPDAAAALAKLAATGDLRTLDEVTLAVETYVLSGGDEDENALRSTLSSLETELSLLDEAARSDTLSVNVPKAGYYSAFADGLETLSPVSEAPLPSEVEAMMRTAASVPADCAGKLVTGIRWQYIVPLSAAASEALTPGDEVSARFPGLFSGTVSMTVVSVGAQQSGRCTVVLESSDHLGDMLRARQAQGELVRTSFTGLRIPADALYEDADTGGYYVYVVEGLQAKRKDVELVGEYNGVYYAAPGALRAGMEIITRANDLSDGKVVR